MEDPVMIGVSAKPIRLAKEVTINDQDVAMCNPGNFDVLPEGVIRLSQTQDHVQWYSKDSPKLYRVGKFYKGFIEEVPAPKHIQQQWETQVFERLSQHLVQMTERLGNTTPTLRAEETATEAELCMAVKKTTAFWRTDKEGSVGLAPTVWISRGGRKCREKVQEEIVRLPYLTHFLSTHQMSAPHVSLGAPRPATTQRPTIPQHDTGSVGAVSFYVQPEDRNVKSAGGINGLKAKFTVHTSQGEYEHQYTTGGLICVRGEIFGLTSAHGVVSEIAYRTAMSQNDNVSNDTSDTESSGTDSESDDDIDSREHVASLVVQGRESKDHELEKIEWKKTPFPRTLAYLGLGTITGNWKLPQSAPVTADFALFNVWPYLWKENYVRIGGNMTRIVGHLSQDQLYAGKVHILTDWNQEAVHGELIDEISCIILRGIIMRTRKIRIAPLSGRGISGAWVVRNDKLCGIVYAAYDRSPYLHMLPADSVFRDVSCMLGGSKVEVYDAKRPSYQDVGLMSPTPSGSKAGSSYVGPWGISK